MILFREDKMLERFCVILVLYFCLGSVVGGVFNICEPVEFDGGVSIKYECDNIFEWVPNKRARPTSIVNVFREAGPCGVNTLFMLVAYGMVAQFRTLARLHPMEFNPDASSVKLSYRTMFPVDSCAQMDLSSFVGVESRGLVVPIDTGAVSGCLMVRGPPDESKMVTIYDLGNFDYAFTKDVDTEVECSIVKYAFTYESEKKIVLMRSAFGSDVVRVAFSLCMDTDSYNGIAGCFSLVRDKGRDAKHLDIYMTPKYAWSKSPFGFESARLSRELAGQMYHSHRGSSASLSVDLPWDSEYFCRYEFWTPYTHFLVMASLDMGETYFLTSRLCSDLIYGTDFGYWKKGISFSCSALKSCKMYTYNYENLFRLCRKLENFSVPRRLGPMNLLAANLFVNLSFNEYHWGHDSNTVLESGLNLPIEVFAGADSATIRYVSLRRTSDEYCMLYPGAEGRISAVAQVTKLTDPSSGWFVDGIEFIVTVGLEMLVGTIFRIVKFMVLMVWKYFVAWLSNCWFVYATLVVEILFVNFCVFVVRLRSSFSGFLFFSFLPVVIYLYDNPYCFGLKLLGALVVA
nr:p65 [Hibiscus green spot virus 2]